MNKHTFLVSDESVNSHGLTVKTKGINLERFNKNPIMLYNHDRTKIIGRWEDLEVKDGKLYADAVFDTSDELGKEIARKVSEGFIKATSLGIVYSPFDLVNETIEKSSLIEISIVPVGSNENTLKMYDSLSLSEYFVNSSQSIQRIGKALNLSDFNSETIITAINNLQVEFKAFQEFKTEVAKERKEEAELITDEAIRRKIVPQHLRAVQLQEFEKDFSKTRNELIEQVAKSYPLKTFSLVKMIENARKEKAKESGKSRAEWNLEDYRRFAPQELEKDPQLYERLIQETYSK